ncbi:MAG: HEPN domain-containing protein [Bacteroidetes bacterium]|nr:HEPN domain-containing protein [Bacteroidota bacterium]
MNRTIEDYINYRLERACESVEEAQLLAGNKSWNATINRLYYACFYAVTALLLKNGAKPRTHTGTRTLFFQKYVKTNIISKDFGNLYSDLFDWRQESDYGDFSFFDKETVLPLFDKVKTFISVIKKQM